MRTGAARGHAGHFHEAGFYGSDTEFRALIVPFAEEGIAAGARGRDDAGMCPLGGIEHLGRRGRGVI